MARLPELLESFENRVSRRQRHLRRWAARQGCNCYRVYDRDIPEMAFVLDVYGPRALLQQYVRTSGPNDWPVDWLEQVRARAASGLELTADQVVARLRRKVDRRVEQHGAQPGGGTPFAVEEGGLKFLVNLDDYVDTGLFLDHRPLRAHVRDRARGRRVLNLYCYTASFSVHAAAGGAHSTTSVDLSNTYLEWASRNLQLNGFTGREHELVRADVMPWLTATRAEGRRFDLMVVDPPAFSSSARMQGVFDVQRDHRALLQACAGLLSETGELYFSTNLRSFTFEATMPGFRAEDISDRTIPEDFRNRAIHHCWRIERSGGS